MHIQNALVCAVKNARVSCDRGSVRDAAAKLGRRHQSESVMLAQVDARAVWYPMVVQLHKLNVAVFGATVNHDGRGGDADGLGSWGAW